MRCWRRVLRRSPFLIEEAPLYDDAMCVRLGSLECIHFEDLAGW
jgi:hypothetical protein